MQFQLPYSVEFYRVTFLLQPKRHNDPPSFERREKYCHMTCKSRPDKINAKIVSDKNQLVFVTDRKKAKNCTNRIILMP